MFGASANDRRGCLALTLTTNLMLRAILLSAILTLATLGGAGCCVGAERLEADAKENARLLAELKAENDAVWDALAQARAALAVVRERLRRLLSFWESAKGSHQ